MAIRYCLASGATPCMEVLVPSASDLSDSTEVLTDIDVIGLEFTGDGGFRRTIFDCKTTNKMSAISRAFWASGLLRYTMCDEAVIILKNKAVYNHRISALEMSVDLHDEISFEDLGKTRDIEFLKDKHYQSSVDRWNIVYEMYAKNKWAESLYAVGRNMAPVSQQPWKVFRRLVADMRSAKGFIDPDKDGHIVIFIDVLAAVFILWSSLGRDIRRFYEPTMSKETFERTLKYYIWGGKESYLIRQEIRQKSDSTTAQDFPAWDKFAALSGLVISAPQELFGCINICRDLAIRVASGKESVHEKALSNSISLNKRARQFIMAAADYMVAAAGLPKEVAGRVQAELGSL